MNPETKQCLYRNYGDYLNDDMEKDINDEKIKKFITIIHEHHELITNKDETFFTLDIEYLEENLLKTYGKKI